MLEKEKEEKEKKEEGGLFGNIKKAAKDTFYGMASHAVVRQMLKQRQFMEHLFMLITLGDMLGIPILPPYYSLELLPYVMPNLDSWKRRLFKERDVTDMLY